jgi:hypothetical protein
VIFRLVALCLNQLRYRVPPQLYRNKCEISVIVLMSKIICVRNVKIHKSTVILDLFVFIWLLYMTMDPFLLNIAVEMIHYLYTTKLSTFKIFYATYLRVTRLGYHYYGTSSHS